MRVRRLGKSYAHPFVVLIALPNELGSNQVGVAAGRAVGGAVQRNRGKRVIRAAIRPLLPQLRQGFDIVLLARRPILQVKSQQVQAALLGLLKRARLLQEK